MPPLQFTEFANEQLADAQRVCLQPFVAHYIEHCEPRRAGNGIAAERTEKLHSVIKLARNLARGDHRSERERISNRLAEHHDVRHNALRLESPKVRAEPTESDLHFVSNTNATCGANVAIYLGQIVRWKDNLPADAWQSLRDVCWPFSPGLQLPANFSDVIRVFRSEIRLASAIDSTIVIGQRRDAYPRFLAGSSWPIEFVRADINQRG